MSLRVQTFLTGFMVLIVSVIFGALLAFVPAQAKTALGGYQLFEQVESGIEAPIQLASLGNFGWSTEIASEYANATNSGRFSGITARNADEAQFLRA
jgi:hypothetical protein